MQVVQLLYKLTWSSNAQMENKHNMKVNSG
jgi:hypothetical protein